MDTTPGRKHTVLEELRFLVLQLLNRIKLRAGRQAVDAGRPSQHDGGRQHQEGECQNGPGTNHGSDGGKQGLLTTCVCICVFVCLFVVVVVIAVVDVVPGGKEGDEK